MFQALKLLFLTLRRILWALQPLPTSIADRDLATVKRAIAVLDVHHDGTRPTIRGVQIARRILERHSMPKHAIRTLTRERDAEIIEQAKRAAAEEAEEIRQLKEIAPPSPAPTLPDLPANVVRLK
jgi:hypothetical protein